MANSSLALTCFICRSDSRHQINKSELGLSARYSLTKKLIQKSSLFLIPMPKRPRPDNRASVIPSTAKKGHRFGLVKIGPRPTGQSRKAKEKQIGSKVRQTYRVRRRRSMRSTLVRRSSRYTVHSIKSVAGASQSS